MDARQLINLRVLDDGTYFSEVVRKLRAAKKGERIALITMGFDPTEPRIAKVMRALIAAVKRGAKATLVVDAHTFMIDHHSDLPNGPIFRHRDVLTVKTPYYRKKIESLETFKKAGGQYHIVNIPQTKLINPVAGRSHIKATIIGHNLYLGGCNLVNSERTDLMVHTNDKTAAKHMHELITNIAQKGDTKLAMQNRDHEVALDAYTSLLLDSGVRDQSLIYDQALELIDNADEWIVMTSRYFPNSTTIRHLTAAKNRGVKVRLHYGHPGHNPNIHGLAQHLVIARERVRNPKDLFALRVPKQKQRLHAKLIATEKGAMIGSHNYVTAGVKLGTAESAIYRRDPDFAKEAAAVIERVLAR